MTFERTRRASPLLRIWLAVLIWAACGLAVPAGAQVPPDTIRRDTVPGDTLVVPIPPQEVGPSTAVMCGYG